MKTIKVNGKEVTFAGDGELSYDDICNLAFPPQQTVTYRKGPKDKPEGILSRGQSVKIVNDMSIECCYTGNA